MRVKEALGYIAGEIRLSRDITVLPDDTFLVSYPKSGNTWARFLVGNLMRADAPVSFLNVESRVPDIHWHHDRFLRRTARPRILKSHSCYEPRYRRVVYIVRDPRDVAVSYYHMLVKMRTIDEAFSWVRFVECFVAGQWDRYGTWGEHVGSWLGARQDSDGFLLLRYEAILRDPYAAVSRLAAFCGLHADARTIRRALERSAADHMRALEARQGHRWKPMRHSRADRPFVRQARSGGWRTELPSEAARRIEAAWGGWMGHFGYLEPADTPETLAVAGTL